MEFLYKIKRIFSPKLGYSGNYNSWKEIKDRTLWSDPRVFEQFKNTIKLVKSGDALFERDGIPMREDRASKIDFPFLTSLLYITSKENKLSVLDFGGGSGSMFWHYSKFITAPKEWTVYDQKHIVDYCKGQFSEVNFVEDFIVADVLLISGTLQYLEDPYIFLNEINWKGYKYILIARTTVSNTDRLTKQTVNPKFYPTRFPNWFLSKTKVPETLSNYKIILKWDNEIVQDIGQIGGWLLKLK